MYEYISGKVAAKTPTHVTIDSNGIGYGILISLQTAQVLKENEQARLYTHLYVREDDQRLYGFYTSTERTTFRLLLSVNGVGANTALLILSALNAHEVSRAIADNDVEQFRRIKGIGPKTAQRIILDLKDKVEKVEGQTSSTNAGESNNTAGAQALSALVHLGFKRPAAIKALKQLQSSSQEYTVEGLIKEALRLLS